MICKLNRDHWSPILNNGECGKNEEDGKHLFGVIQGNEHYWRISEYIK